MLVDLEGNLAPATFGTISTAVVPAGFCGAAVSAGRESVRIPLPESAAYHRGAVVQLGLLIGDASHVTVAVEDPQGRIIDAPIMQNPELLRGPYRMTTLVPYGADVLAIHVKVSGANAAGICVTSAAITVPREES